MDDDLVEALKEDVTGITTKLAYRIGVKVKTRARLLRSGEALGITVEDVVNETVRLAMDTRSWNKAKYLDVVDYLVSIADSVISGRLRKPDSKRTTYTEQEDWNCEAPSPEEAAAAREELARLDRTVAEAAASNSLLGRVWECFREGFTDPSDIVELLDDVPAQEVLNCRRRLRRLLWAMQRQPMEVQS